MNFIISILTKILTVELGKKILINLLKNYRDRPDNKIDDDIVESVIEALNDKPCL